MTTRVPRLRRFLLILTSVAACGLALAQVANATPDGGGSLDYVDIPVGNGATDIGLQFVFSLDGGDQFVNGALQITVPSGWQAPSTDSSQPGYTTSDCGTVSASGQTLTITGISLVGPGSCDIFFGDLPGPGLTAPTTPGPYTFSTQTKATSGGTFTPIATSPDVQVLAPDGSGTITSDTQSVAAGSTGNTIKFTYTAAFGGIFDGTLMMRIPASWSPPSDNGTDPGFVTATLNGSVFPFVVPVAPRVFAFLLVMDQGDQLELTYGDKTSGGPGATASSAPGRQAWPTFLEASCSCSSDLLPLASQPVIRTRSADGSGTMTTKRTDFSASSRQTMVFTYRPAPGGLENGVVSLVVPNDWSPPSTTPGDPGYVTATAGTVSTSGRTITVSALTMFGGGLGITYGSRTGGGPGALVTSTPGAATWTAKQRSGSPGTLTPLASSPQTTVFAPDGSGTLTTPTSTVTHGSSGNTVAFTYTAAAGGLSNGSLTLRLPAGWSAPSTSNLSPGYTTSNAGTVSSSGQTIVVSGLTIATGGTVTIIYGSQSGGGPGATAPATLGPRLWRGAEGSTDLYRLVLSSSPTITVN